VYAPLVTVPAIDVDAAATALAGGSLLLDVRQPGEYDEVHAEGAVLVPLDQLVERVDEVPTDRTVYVICRSGPRSAKAVEFLRSVGVDAINVTGGTLAWVEAGHPSAAGDRPS
jgi:rhodanese-related sulfurtransferase